MEMVSLKLSRWLTLPAAMLMAGMAGVTGVTIVDASQQSASAHVGNIKVDSAVCVDSDTMRATYRAGWSNNPSGSGKLYQRSGLHGKNGDAGSSTAGWTYVGDVSGTNGSGTFTITHAKSSFSGGNGPWWSSKIVFKNGYGVAADTRVEKFDWNSCKPKVVKDAAFTKSVTEATCDAPARLTFSGTSVTFNQQSPVVGPGSVNVTAEPVANREWVGGGTETRTVFSGVLADMLPKKQCSQAPPPKVTEVSDSKKTCEGEWSRKGSVKTPYVWSDEKDEYVLGTPGEPVWGNWTKVRDLTPAEKAQLDCPKPDKPEPIVKPLEKSDKDCNGVFETKGTKTINWTFDTNAWEWVKGEPVITWNDPVKVRDLTFDEKVELGCVKVVDVPGAAKQLDPCGLDNATWVKPDDTDKVYYELDEDGHLWAFTKEGYAFKDGSTSRDFGVATDSNELCDTAPVNPDVTQAVCTAPGEATEPKITLSGNSDEVTYELDGQTVIARASKDYEFGEVPEGWVVSEDRKTATFNVVFTDPGDCIEDVTPVTFEVTDPTCTTDGSLVIPAQPDGVKVSPDAGSYGPGEYDVTFSADEGYRLASNPGGHVVIGAATGYQGDNPEAACYSKPPKPDKDTDRKVVCVDGDLVAIERVTEQKPVLDKVTGEYSMEETATSSQRIVKKGAAKCDDRDDTPPQSDKPKPPTKKYVPPATGGDGTLQATDVNWSLLGGLLSALVLGAGGVAIAGQRRRN